MKIALEKPANELSWRFEMNKAIIFLIATQAVLFLSPKSSVAAESACQDVKCPKGARCEDVVGKAFCVCDDNFELVESSDSSEFQQMCSDADVGNIENTAPFIRKQFLKKKTGSEILMVFGGLVTAASIGITIGLSVRLNQPTSNEFDHIPIGIGRIFSILAGAVVGLPMLIAGVARYSIYDRRMEYLDELTKPSAAGSTQVRMIGLGPLIGSDNRLSGASIIFEF